MQLNLALATLIAVLGVSSVQAAQPRTINYQGSLMDGNGLVSPDGNYSMSFRLWDAAAGGLLLWQETDTVAVAAGLFNVTLGKNSPFALTFTNPYWLGITVGTNPELTPRVKLSASPYAMHAVAADSLAGGLPTALSCSVTIGALNVPSGGVPPYTLVPFSSEEWDMGSFHDAGSPARLTVPVSGMYLVSGYADWDGNATGLREIELLRNGVLAAGPLALSGSLVAATGGFTEQSASGIVRLNAGEFMTLMVFQNSGGARALDWARMTIVYLGR